MSDGEPIKLALRGSPREVRINCFALTMGQLISGAMIATANLSVSCVQIGVKHGRSLKDQIRDQMRIYESMFEYTSKLSWHEVREVAKEFAPTIQRLTPHIFAEMEGIAEGAQVDILDIVALNCRSEIALGKFSDGCTTLCWKTNDNVRVLSQNWDWTATVKKNLAMVSIEQPGKPSIYMVTEVRHDVLPKVVSVITDFHFLNLLGWNRW